MKIAEHALYLVPTTYILHILDKVELCPISKNDENASNEKCGRSILLDS